MKMLVAIVQDKDAGKLLQRLVKEKISATRLSSTGGFLRSGNTTLLIGVKDEQQDEVIEIIRQTCRKREELIPQTSTVMGPADPHIPFPIQVPVGGATIFSIHVDQFIKV